MEETDKNISEIELEEKNTVLQFWADAKDSMFNVIFVILDKKAEDQEEESLLGLSLQTGLDYLQILAFPFNELVIGAWNGGQSLTSITNFFQKFNVSNYLPGAPYQAFLAMLYGLIVIILLIIIDIVYVSYSFSKKKFSFTFPLVILAQVVPLFITVLFLPITEILLNVVNCKVVEGGSWQMVNYPTVACWEGWHLFHATITMLFVTLFVLISSVVALALFQPRLTSKKMTARQNSNGEVVFIINKIVLQFFFSFSPFSDNTFYVVILFLLSFWQFWCYAIRKPYYSKVASKFFKICSTYYFWTSLMLLVGLMLTNYNFNGAVLIWMGGLPFFAIIIYFDIDLEINELFASNLKFKTGQQLQSHISYVLQLVQNQKDDKNSHMLLIGYIQKHKQLCKQADCPLNEQIKKEQGQPVGTEGSELIIKQIERMFITGLQKFPQCTKLRISYAFFNLEILRNTEKAYEEFDNTSKLNPNFEQQFNIYRFKKIIRENLQNREQSDADLVQIIRYENHVSLLEEAMLISAKLHKQFWSQLKQETPDLKRLNLIGSQITQTGNSIAENYNQIVKINSSGCQILYSYAYYLILVNQDYNQGKQLLANAKKLYNDKQNDPKAMKDLSLDNQALIKITNPMIIISKPLNSDSGAKIINTNLLFAEIMGYKRQEILNKQLSAIESMVFTSNDCSGLELSQVKEYQRQVFFNHKYNYLVSLIYKVIPQVDASQFNILFKMRSENGMRLMIFSNLYGEVTDYNLQAQIAFKQQIFQAELLNMPFRLQHIGLTYEQSPLQCSNIQTDINISNQPTNCYIEVETLKVTLKVMGQEQSNQEEQSMITSIQKPIGFKITLLRVASLAKSMAKQVEKPYSDDENEQKTNGLIENIVQLYEHPNIIQIYTPNIVQSRLAENQVGFALKEKIVTMRLMNNEIKMVYNKDNQNDYNYKNQNDNEDDLEMFKFDDESYQAKLKAAINTNLNHIEVYKLTSASYIFIFSLFLLHILTLLSQNNTLTAINYSIYQNTLRIKQYTLLTSNIVSVISPNSNYSAYYNLTQKNLIDFQTNVNVNLVLENNFTARKNLKDAVILMNSRLLNYFKNPLTPIEIKSIFVNFISSIYPAFLTHPIEINTGQLFVYLLSAGVGIISLAMMAYWIYISLLIDKKRNDIMIWFLDIPIPYVTHLGNHCDNYLKDFLTVKQLIQKGISMEQEDQDAFEQFSVKKNATDEEQIQEQIKSRKSLISKNKKETLISKLNLSFLKVLWIIIYSSVFSIIILVLSENYLTNITFLAPQMIQTTQAITVDNTLALTMELIDQNIIKQEVDLNALIVSLNKYHHGIFSKNNLQNFNYKILQYAQPTIANIYNQIYFQNLCKNLKLPASNITKCQSIVNSKLKSGYSVYSKYLIAPDVSKYVQIKTANQLYVIPALISILDLWQKKLLQQSNSIVNLCSVILYVFIIISVLGFLIGWLYYLKKLNTELNQTIQMLNMIPFKLLPKSRKQTKVFIAWIIRQANKSKHQSE